MLGLVWRRWRFPQRGGKAPVAHDSTSSSSTWKSSKKKGGGRNKLGRKRGIQRTRSRGGGSLGTESDENHSSPSLENVATSSSDQGDVNADVNSSQGEAFKSAQESISATTEVDEMLAVFSKWRVCGREANVEENVHKPSTPDHRRTGLFSCDDDTAKTAATKTTPLSGRVADDEKEIAMLKDKVTQPTSGQTSRAASQTALPPLLPSLLPPPATPPRIPWDESALPQKQVLDEVAQGEAGNGELDISALGDDTLLNASQDHLVDQSTRKDASMISMYSEKSFITARTSMHPSHRVADENAEKRSLNAPSDPSANRPFSFRSLFASIFRWKRSPSSSHAATQKSSRSSFPPSSTSLRPPSSSLRRTPPRRPTPTRRPTPEGLKPRESFGALRDRLNLTGTSNNRLATNGTTTMQDKTRSTSQDEADNDSGPLLSPEQYAAALDYNPLDGEKEGATMILPPLNFDATSPFELPSPSEAQFGGGLSPVKGVASSPHLAVGEALTAVGALVAESEANASAPLPPGTSSSVSRKLRIEIRPRPSLSSTQRRLETETPISNRPSATPACEHEDEVGLTGVDPKDNSLRYANGDGNGVLPPPLWSPDERSSDPCKPSKVEGSASKRNVSFSAMPESPSTGGFKNHSRRLSSSTIGSRISTPGRLRLSTLALSSPSSSTYASSHDNVHDNDYNGYVHTSPSGNLRSAWEHQPLDDDVHYTAKADGADPTDFAMDVPYRQMVDTSNNSDEANWSFSSQQLLIRREVDADGNIECDGELIGPIAGRAPYDFGPLVDPENSSNDEMALAVHSMHNPASDVGEIVVYRNSNDLVVSARDSCSVSAISAHTAGKCTELVPASSRGEVDSVISFVHDSLRSPDSAQEHGSMVEAQGQVDVHRYALGGDGYEGDGDDVGYGEDDHRFHFPLDEDLRRRKMENQQTLKEAALLDLVRRIQDNPDLLAEVEALNEEVDSLAQSMSRVTSEAANPFVRTPMNEDGVVTGYNTQDRETLLTNLESILHEMDIAQEEECLLIPGSFEMVEESNRDLRRALLFVCKIVETAIRSDEYDTSPPMDGGAMESSSRALIGAGDDDGRQGGRWMPQKWLREALGLTEGGEVFLATDALSLPTNSSTPNTSNVSMATSLTTQLSPIRPLRDSADAFRRQGAMLCRTIEVVATLLQKISIANTKILNLEKCTTDVTIRATEELKRNYLQLMLISWSDLAALNDAFTKKLPNDGDREYAFGRDSMDRRELAVPPQHLERDFIDSEHVEVYMGRMEGRDPEMPNHRQVALSGYVGYERATRDVNAAEPQLPPIVVRSASLDQDSHPWEDIVIEAQDASLSMMAVGQINDSDLIDEEFPFDEIGCGVASPAAPREDGVRDFSLVSEAKHDESTCGGVHDRASREVRDGPPEEGCDLGRKKTSRDPKRRAVVKQHMAVAASKKDTGGVSRMEWAIRYENVMHEMKAGGESTR